jgi:hypothetical protein
MTALTLGYREDYRDAIAKAAHAKPVQREHIEQVHVFTWAAIMAPTYPALAMLFACPNGGARNIITAARLKAEGVKKGVPDIFLPLPCGRWHGLVIEMKAKGGRISPEQRWWITHLSDAGYQVEVCWNAEEAIDTISNYLGIGRI